MRMRLVRWLAIGLIAGACLVPSARACDPAAPDLHARQVGRDVVLTWTGTLAVGETWNVSRGDLNVLWDVGFNDSSIGTVSVEQYTDTNGAADADWDYFRVRCEGPGGDGPWSNLGFKAVRQFDTVMEGGTGGDFRNIYFVSLPERLGMPDIADTADPDPCAPASGVGDGIVNADDLLCSWWTSGQGSLTVSGFDADNCRFLDRMILRDETSCASAPVTHHLGSWTAPLASWQALIVTATHRPGTAAALNSGVMVGSSDPARPCQQVREPSLGASANDCQPRQMLLAIPWDGLDRGAREILCGREGRDWTYTDPPMNHRPSDCDAGTFNDATRKSVSVVMFDNVDDDSSATADNQFSWSSVSQAVLSSYTFAGVPYPLRPTDAVLHSISVGHGSTLYCPERR